MTTRAAGIKLTHDASVAVIEDGRLLFSDELEKRANSVRHSSIAKLGQISMLLREHDLRPDDIDRWSIDGWGNDAAQYLLELEASHEQVWVSGYQDKDQANILADPGLTADLHLPDADRIRYVSFSHATNHAMSAYATSPFARASQDSLVLVWDGGMPPTLYHADPRGDVDSDGPRTRLRRIGTAGPWFGNLYPDFISYFGPFPSYRVRGRPVPYQLSLPGTAMAYAALGVTDAETVSHLTELLESGEFGRASGDQLAERFLAGRGDVSDEDVIASFQACVGRLLARRVAAAVADQKVPRLCITGGCALNIGWNSQIRDVVAAHMWIPPFPNDSGIAIGAAAAALAHAGAPPGLEWDVYSGLPVVPSAPLDGWDALPCSPEKLGHLLARAGEPVVVVNGRAELGPRALGNRSILAPPTEGMLDRLNEIKEREPYRPVAPVCAEDAAPRIFDPGTPDPYMLYVHRVREEWRSRIPAVTHVDGTARLQTVNPEKNATLYEIIAGHQALTGIPVVCNTSANHKGAGFFPDVRSAMAWGRTRYVWSEGVLYDHGST